jgi:peptidoglycan/xylan/chitin deacetylase (PgdA/CDA1 family)
MKRMTFLCLSVILLNACTFRNNNTGKTEIAKWQFDKRGAVSITYDDGSINQFRKALPIMNRLKIPATFYIITSQVAGSQYQGRFIGRPIKTIIRETAKISTNKENIFERTSAAAFLGYKGTLEYCTRAGSLIDAGKPEEAYTVIDELYKKVRNDDFPSDTEKKYEDSKAKFLTWDSIRTYAAQGHEFASHMVTHPYMSALDEPNMLYELEKSREDILKQLGPKYTFSAELPYGTEDERAMSYAYKVYPALRNRMPENFIEELNRSSIVNPGSVAGKEYVQWQRGATTKTPLPIMKSWIDTTASKDNIWLVLVIHGVDSIGWEALPSELLDEYFRYIKSKDKDLWIATFADATKYLRERMNSDAKIIETRGKITVTLTHSLDKTIYNIPLTLKTYVSSKWREVLVKQGGENKKISPQKDGKGSFVLYQATPNAGDIEISAVNIP